MQHQTSNMSKAVTIRPAVLVITLIGIVLVIYSFTGSRHAKKDLPKNLGVINSGKARRLSNYKNSVSESRAHDEQYAQRQMNMKHIESPGFYSAQKDRFPAENVGQESGLQNLQKDTDSSRTGGKPNIALRSQLKLSHSQDATVKNEWHIFFIPNPNVSHVKTTNKWITSCTFLDYFKLGNQLFVFASVYGIARRNNITPVVKIRRDWKTSSLLRGLFEAPMIPDPIYFKREESHPFQTSSFARYDPKTESFGSMKTNSVSLCGHYQSWKYFKGYESEIRKQLTFLPAIRQRAERHIDQLLPEHYKDKKYIRVGVHVRRGDIVRNKDLPRLGHKTAPTLYFKHAMDYFRFTFTDVVFIACSDDLNWTVNHIKGDDVFYSIGKDPVLDFTVLSILDHTIISVGTYGWWAAWLANGTTTYYKYPFHRNTKLYKQFQPEDHFPSHWIPME